MRAIRTVGEHSGCFSQYHRSRTGQLLPFSWSSLLVCTFLHDFNFIVYFDLSHQDIAKKLEYF